MPPWKSDSKWPGASWDRPRSLTYTYAWEKGTELSWPCTSSRLPCVYTTTWRRSTRPECQANNNLPRPYTDGRTCAQGAACSYAAAACSTSRSACHRPTICSATGRPSLVKPQGTLAAGCPGRLKGKVKVRRSDIEGGGLPSSVLGGPLRPHTRRTENAPPPPQSDAALRDPPGHSQNRRSRLRAGRATLRADGRQRRHSPLAVYQSTLGHADLVQPSPQGVGQHQPPCV